MEEKRESRRKTVHVHWKMLSYNRQKSVISANAKGKKKLLFSHMFFRKKGGLSNGPLLLTSTLSSLFPRTQTIAAYSNCRALFYTFTGLFSQFSSKYTNVKTTLLAFVRK